MTREEVKIANDIVKELEAIEANEAELDILRGGPHYLAVAAHSSYVRNTTEAEGITMFDALTVARVERKDVLITELSKL